MRTIRFAETLRAIGIAALINALFLAVLTFFLGTANFPNGNQTVYTTKTGECYHLSNCASLSHSKYETTISEAVQSGFRRCSNCDPPALQDGPIFASLHYYFVIPIAAIWSFIASIEIFMLESKYRYVLYPIHVGLSILFSIGFDALF